MKTKILLLRSLKWLSALLILIGYVLVACSPIQDDVPLTPLPSSTNTHTPSPSPRPSATRHPTITPTPTLRPLSTLVPFMALPPEYAQALLLELFDTNAGCHFPCWWGITPGETSWESAHGFLASFTSEIYTWERTYDQVVYDEYFPVFDVPEAINAATYFSMGFRTNDEGVIDFIRTNNPWSIDNPDFSLSGLLSTYGVPTEVRIYTDIIPDDLLSTTYHVIYADQGIMFSYHADDDLISNTGKLCPHKITEAPQLWLWDPELELSFASFVDNEFVWNLHNSYPNLEDVTELDVNSFYETYKDPNTRACFETPGELWLWWGNS